MTAAIRLHATNHTRLLLVLFIGLTTVFSNSVVNAVIVNDNNNVVLERTADDTTTATATAANGSCTVQQMKDHPLLCTMLYRKENDLFTLANEMYEWASYHGFIINFINSTSDNNSISNVRTGVVQNKRQQQQKDQNEQTTQQQQLPVVIAHGMGDSCYNDGIVHIIDYISKLLNNVYCVCIPIGTNQQEDTSNGFLLNMDASVEIFSSSIQNNIQLQNGFHAIGFSQGNNIIRGYIAKHNTPTVHTFISINGVNAGTGAVPYCIPSLTSTTTSTSSNTRISRNLKEQQQKVSSSSLVNNSLCNFMMEIASNRAYTEFVQEHSFQANYWRDPRISQRKNYELYCQLAKWNNEITTIDNSTGQIIPLINNTLRINYNKTTKFVWIVATEDQMIWPKEGEQWGTANSNVDDPFTSPILSRYNTTWYQQDLFGLQTAELYNKNIYESFVGDHLQFTLDELHYWIITYLQ